MKKTILLSLLFTGSLLAAPAADHAPADSQLYLEITASRKMLTAVSALYSDLRGKAGADEWRAAGAQLRLMAGLNLLDPAELSQTGLNVDSEIGITIRNLNPGTAPVNYGIIIPANDPAKLYKMIRDIAESQAKAAAVAASEPAEPQYDEETGEELPPIGTLEQTKPSVTFTEIRAGELFQVTGNEPVFVLKAAGNVIIGDSEARVRGLAKPAASPVSKAPHYTALRKKILGDTGTGSPVMIAYITPEAIVNFSKLPAGAGIPGADIAAKLNAEMTSNLIGAAGGWTVGKNKTKLLFHYLYKDNYLNDTTKLMPSVYAPAVPPNLLDRFSANPVVYTTLKIHLAPIVSWLRESDPNMAANITSMETEVQNATGLGLEKDILAALRGNYSFVLAGIPPEKTLKTFSAWEGYAAIGLVPGKDKVMTTILDKVMQMQNQSADKSLVVTAKAFQNGRQYSFTNKAGFSGNNKPESVIVYVGAGEMIITNSLANLGKALKPGTTNLSDRLLKVSYTKTTGVFYIDLQKIVKAANASSVKAMVTPYLPYLSRLSHIGIHSQIDGNYMTSEMVLELLP